MEVKIRAVPEDLKTTILVIRKVRKDIDCSYKTSVELAAIL